MVLLFNSTDQAGQSQQPLVGLGGRWCDVSHITAGHRPAHGSGDERRHVDCKRFVRHQGHSGCQGELWLLPGPLAGMLLGKNLGTRLSLNFPKVKVGFEFDNI